MNKFGRMSFIPLLVFIVLALGMGAASAYDYKVTDLGALGGEWSWAFDVNDRGQVVGYYRNPASELIRAFLYGNGGMRDLGFGPEYSSFAYAINRFGFMAGACNVPSTGEYEVYHACIFTPAGRIIDIGKPPYGKASSSSCAYDINDWGQAVGFDDQGAFVTTPCGYRVSLNLGQGSYACGINALGQAVGRLDPNGRGTAFLYSHGRVYDLGTLGGSESCAEGINTAGQVVGWSSNEQWYYDDTGIPFPVVHAFLYHKGVMKDLGTLGGILSYAKDIDERGRVVGMSETAGGEAHAFLYENGRMTDLNSLISRSSGWLLWEADGINSRGQIVGYGVHKAKYHAFLLTPK